MEPHGFENLGAQDKPTDTRDVKLGAVTPKTYTFPPTFRNEFAWSIPVEYQGDQPACGAHSGSTLNGIKKGARFTPRFTWADIKSFDGWPIESGTDIRSIMKSLTKTGTLYFNDLGNNVTLSKEEYAHPAITPDMREVALKNKGSGYGFADDLTFKGLKQYIYDRGAVVVLLRVGKEWWTAADGQSSWQEKDILPLRTPQQIVSGHFVVAHSYDEDRIYFLNSWSDNWGMNGHGYFEENYMPWINDAAAFVPLAFTKDLYSGMTDPEVKQLQVLLNKDPRTRVALVGAGSPGKETTYFGSLTKNAVMRFQTLHNIKPVQGYVGVLTRAVLNTM